MNQICLIDIHLFISLVNDTNKEKEYLLSISSYITILELHDLENDEYIIEKANTFFEKDLGIYSFVFQVLESKFNNTNQLFCIYILIL